MSRMSKLVVRGCEAIIVKLCHSFMWSYSIHPVSLWVGHTIGLASLSLSEMLWN